MPRAKYIYFVRESEYEGSHNRLLGAFTVKSEANLWAFRNGWGTENATLSRMRDGVGANDYPETVIDWADVWMKD